MRCEQPWLQTKRLFFYSKRKDKLTENRGYVCNMDKEAGGGGHCERVYVLDIIDHWALQEFRTLIAFRYLCEPLGSRMQI